MTVPTTFQLRVGDEWFNCTSNRCEDVREFVFQVESLAKEDPRLWMRVRNNGIEQMIRWENVTNVRLQNSEPDWTRQ